MRFLRENLFLIVTCATVLVVGGFLLGLAHSLGSQADEYARVRTDESLRVQRVRGAKVNASVVEAAVAKVEMISGSARGVADYCFQRNQGDYPVITFDIRGRKVEAFPIDADLYRRESLRWFFPQLYDKALSDLLKSLRPTRPPIEEEISLEAERIARRETPAGAEGVLRPGTDLRRPGITGPSLMMRGPLDTRYRYDPDRLRPRMQPPTRSDDRLRVRPGTGPDIRGRSVTGTATQPAGAEGQVPTGPTARERAERKLILAKSQQGWVYAEVDDLDRQLITTEATSDYADDELWLAQVGLWVQRDIVAAVNLTNVQARQEVSSGDAEGVPGSAIKRLVSTHIRGYVVRGGAVTSGTRQDPAGERAAGRMGYVSAWAGTYGSPPGLTGRACNQLYDVLHYDFTVILPARYLRRLYRNLRLQNFHTVLDVEIDEPGLQKEPTQAALSARSRGGTQYYYGTDPVVQATIVGEMLLLADWTRGRWNPQQKKWDSAPLMPEKFLGQIATAEVLREGDKTRAVAPAASAGPSGYMGPGGMRPEGRYDDGLRRRR